jgi:hypothetical protein
MKPLEWIPETTALELIAERINGDLEAAVIEYLNYALEGKIEIWEDFFSEYGFDKRPIPRERWAGACYDMSHPAAANFGPIYWSGRAAQEAGLGRWVRWYYIDQFWPSSKEKRGEGKSPVKGVVKERHREIAEAAEQLVGNLAEMTAKERGDALREHLRPRSKKGYDDQTIDRVLKKYGLL